MKIQDLFERDIHRPINGVVKADQLDASSVWQELDEFVVTNELRRHFGDLVGVWDVVAFDEVAGIHFKDHDGVQIMKDYMASGSFARGRDSLNASAAMVFVGNIDNVTTLLKTSHLLSPFPEAMIDAAFFDRFHAYIPGWEIPKMRPEFFTNQYGFIVDYLAEIFREMRKYTFGDAISKYFQLGRDLNQRDTIAVKRSVSGLLKLLYPTRNTTKKQCANASNTPWKPGGASKSSSSASAGWSSTTSTSATSTWRPTKKSSSWSRKKAAAR
jgi:hypothetical protein